jgi:hypothetical protein
VITVVSGVPRSGTSLMMQMLAAGGMPLLADSQRAPDEDNPRGYFEWERIKRLSQQPDCLAEAEGKAVKITSPLLWALLPNRTYRVVFMRRPLAEVLRSQTAMIRRLGATGARLERPAMIAALEAHLRQVSAWLERQPHIQVCWVHYHRLLEDPRGEAERIQGFLQVPLDIEAMAQQVDPSLYRQREPPLA